MLDKWYSILILYGNVDTPEQINGAAGRIVDNMSKRSDAARLLYYGRAAAGVDINGQSAVGRLAYIVEIDVGQCPTAEAAMRAARNRLNEFGSYFEQIVASYDVGLKKGRIHGYPTVQKAVEQMKYYNVPCLYEYGKKSPALFVYGDVAQTVSKFELNMSTDVATFLAGQAQVDPGSIKFDVLDGRVTLLFTVSMNGSKNDFEDTSLQRKVNELRKLIKSRYGVDVDVVDIRSVITYS